MFRESQPHSPETHRESEQRHTTSEQRVIDRVKEFIAQNKVEVLGTGQSGTVLLFTDEQVDARWVMKRETGRSGKQQELGMTFEDEFKIHNTIYETIEQARATNKRKKFAKIPRPYTYIHDNEACSWIAMETLQGETLFERAARNLLLTFTEDEEERAGIENMRKEQLLDELFKNYTTAFGDEHFTRIANEARRYSKGNCPFLTREQFTAIKNTVEELHKHGIHHRDLHASNIMLLKDGSVAIIDFGTSIQVNSASPEAASVYTMKTVHIDERTKKVTKIIPDTVQVRTFENYVTK